MSRPIRIYYPGLIYHILNRGNNRQIVFVEEQDYRHYLDILQRYKEKFGFKIFAFCLMTNHVHLLLQVSEKASISKIMQAITIAHTRYYHYKYQLIKGTVLFNLSFVFIDVIDKFGDYSVNK